MHSPRIVAITDLRRDGPRIIDGAAASGAPVFVTQRGRVTAVLVSRDLYDSLVGAFEPPHADACEPAFPAPEPRPPGALFQTKFGLVDAETADFLAEEGWATELWTRRPDGATPADPSKDGRGGGGGGGGHGSGAGGRERGRRRQ